MNGACGTLRPWPTSGTRVLDHLLTTSTMVHNESTESLDVDACPFSGRSPGYLISQAYEPPGRRETEVNAERGPLEAVRNQVKEKGLGQ